MEAKAKPTRPSPNICDYEGSNYRTDFWEGQGREYEDLVERIAIRRMLPASGVRMLEIGAAFGRLTEEYNSYQEVVLLDYSFSQLQYARQHHGDGRFHYVAADAYKMPFAAGTFDGATMIRVIHHMADAPKVLTEVRRVLADQATFILEYANKRNLKAMLRYALKQQEWNPYDPAPIEFVELNFDFHPQYMAETLQATGFKTTAQSPVSFFRVPLLKKTIPAGILAKLDGVLQHSGALVTPSVFTRNTAQSTAATRTDQTATALEALLVCPEHKTPLHREGDTMVCAQYGTRYAIRDGIYDFKAPISG